MNDIIQTWFPVVSAIGVCVAIGLNFWMGSVSDAKAEGKVNDLRNELKAELATVVADSKARDDSLKSWLNEVDQRAAANRERLIAVEEGLKNLPTQRDFLKMNENMLTIGGDVKKLVAEVVALGKGQERTERQLEESTKRTERSINVINETLMAKS